MSWRAALVGFALILWAPAPLLRGQDSRGAEGGEEADAKTLFQQGDRLASEKKYGDALKAWTKAYFTRLPEYRDLEFLHPVSAKVMSRPELRKFVLVELAREYPDEVIEADRLVYSQFGFISSDLDLKQVLVNVMTEEIAGFYDPDTKALYLIGEQEEKPARKPGLWEKLFGSSDSFKPEEEKAVLSHELAHALADQHFDLHSLSRSVEEDDDMALALAALVEGEATMVMILDMVDEGGREGRALMRQVARLDGSFLSLMVSVAAFFGSGKSFRRAPLVLRESLIFPYLKGLVFCGNLTTDGRWEAVDTAFRRPPLSTEQILHPRKFLDESRDDPVTLRFAKPAPLDNTEWQLVKSNVLGEFGIEVLLRPRVGKRKSASVAAGWDGDLYHVYRRKGARPERVLLVWVTTWDSAKDAAEFSREFLAYSQARDKGDEDEGNSDGTSQVAAPEGLREAERLWRGAAGVSGIWREGADVWFLDQIPDDKLRDLARWSFQLERQPKSFRLKKVKPRVSFPEN